MEDIIFLLVTAAIMIGGAISSANKKKKAQQKTAPKKQEQNRSDGRRTFETFGKDGETGRRSLKEIVEEMAAREEAASSQEEFEPFDEEDDYYEQEIASLEEMERAADRLQAITYVEPERTAAKAKFAVDEIKVETEAEEGESDRARDIAEEFDLRRAIIETEILKPKYEQY